MVGITPTTRPDAPAGELGEHLLLGAPTGTLAPGQLSFGRQAASSAPEPVRIPGGGVTAAQLCPSRLVRATHCQTLDHPFPARPRFGQRRASRSPTTATRLTGARDVACPAAPMYSGSSALRELGCSGRGRRTPVCPDSRIAPVAWTPVAWTPVAWTPVAWTPVAWTPDVHPSSWLDGRPHGGQRTRTERRPAWPASGHPRRPRRLGGPNLARAAASAALGNP